MFASGLVDLLSPGPFDGADHTEQLPAVIDGLGSMERAEALAILRGLAAVLPELEAMRARRAADTLAASGVREPAWAAQVGRAVVTEAWLMSHVLGDGDNVMLACRYPDGREHTLVVYIDHNLGTLVKDAFVGPPDVVKQFRELVDDDDTTIEPIEPADAAARIRPAAELSSITVPPIETDMWPAMRALLDARLATVPANGSPPQRPDLSEAERDRLIDDFLAADEGNPWRDDPEAVGITHQLVWFRCDHGDGRPLRWSTVVVEMLLTDWFPRKVAGPASMHAKVPDALRSWIRFAGRTSAVPPRLVNDTLAAVDELAEDFHARSPNPESWGAARSTVQQMLELGVDLTDPDAVISHLEGQRASGALAGAPAEAFEWRGISSGLRHRVEEVLGHCDRVCAEVLDAEYTTLCRRSVAKLARKRPSPLAQGDTRIWAGGVLYAVGQVNFLFDPSTRPHVTGSDPAAVVGVNPSTIGQKAKAVPDATGIRELGPEIMRSDLRAYFRFYLGLPDVDQAAFVGEHRDLHAVAQAQLGQEPGDVRLHRRLAEEQLRADRCIGQPAGHAAGDRHLPLGQRRDLLGHHTRQWSGGEPLEQPPGHRGGQHRLPSGHDADGLHQVVRRHVLEQEPARPGLHGGVDVLVEVEGRQRQHARRRRCPREQPPGGLDAVESRHPDVHQDDVGPELDRQLDRRDAVTGLADDGHAGLLQDQGEARPHQLLVVDDQHTHHAGATGSVARTVSPAPSVDVVSSRPP
jgi:hypothetical protein